MTTKEHFTQILICFIWKTDESSIFIFQPIRSRENTEENQSQLLNYLRNGNHWRVNHDAKKIISSLTRCSFRSRHRRQYWTFHFSSSLYCSVDLFSLQLFCFSYGRPLICMLYIKSNPFRRQFDLIECVGKVVFLCYRE